MGLGKNWTQEELDYLESVWGTVSIPTIADRLGRSVDAIKVKASKLQLGPVLLAGDYITLNQLVRAVTGTHNVYTYHLTSWVEKRGLPIHTKKVNQCSFRVVFLREFWEWAERNRSFIDFSRMEPMILGEEPEWVAAQRRKDFESYALQRKDPWTPLEDQRLLHLLEMQKYGYRELSEMLHRSAGAIQRRCTDLKTKLRPVRAENRGPDSTWTSDDFAILADGIKSGDSYTAIGNRIGKSEKAVRGKVYTVYLTENADKVRRYIGSGDWGDGAPEPTVKQGVCLSRTRSETRKALSELAGILKVRMNQLGYDPYWQRFMCANWDDFDGCSAGCDDCDSCVEFRRIKPQYCKRCGATFYERKEALFCEPCRKARKKQAQRKWSILNAREKRRSS